jgi:catalase-peroxidase
MGPKARYLGPEVPAEDLIWQDPVPGGTTPGPDRRRHQRAEGKIAASGLTVSQLVKTAWAAASTYRKSDHRGGANGARVRLAPQNGLGGQRTGEAGPVLAKAQRMRGSVSLADAIVLGGVVGVEDGGQGGRTCDHRAVHWRARRCHGRADRCCEL